MRGKAWLVKAAFLLFATGIQMSAVAFAREGGSSVLDRNQNVGVRNEYRLVRYPHRVFVGPAFGFGWGWGYPWGWGPYYYPGPNVVEVHRVTYGTLEFKVKPEDTKIYVDQKYIGMVKDLDHHKAYLPAGNHDIKLVVPDEQTMDRTLYVAAGQKIKIDESL